MPLSEYVLLHFSGNQAEFARHMGVSRQKVNGWVADDWFVFNGKLYSPKRDIPALSSAHK